MIRLLVAEGERQERDALRRAAIDDPRIGLVGVARDGQEAVQLAVQHRPDVVVLAEQLKVVNGFEAAGLISAAAPGVKSLLLVAEDAPAVLERAMQMGARRCLRRPAAPARILDVAAQLADVDTIRERPEFRTAVDPAQFPRLVAITGGKGGVGKTSLSTNLAVALAKLDRGPTCMVDLYTQFGDVGTMLDVRPKQTLVDLVALDDEIDSDVVAGATVQHPSGLHVLLGSTTPHALDALPVERLEQVLSALRRRYRFIIVDVPPFLHAGTLHVLEAAHMVLLVCNLMDLTTVTDTLRMLESVGDAYVSRDRLRLLLNRVGKQNQLAPERVQETVGIPPWAMIPNADGIVSQCINQGRPFVLEHPSHPVSQAVRRMAEMLADSSDAVPAAESPAAALPERRGFFSLFGRPAQPELKRC